MYCSNCGAELKSEDKFCSNCGQKITALEISNAVDTEVVVPEVIDEAIEKSQPNKGNSGKNGCGCGCLVVILCLLFMFFSSCGKDKEPEKAVVEQKQTQEVKNIDKEKAPKVQQEKKQVVEEPKHVESTRPSNNVVKTPAVSQQTENRVSATYVGNVKTRKYHREGCSSVTRMKAANRTYFDSSSSARSAGYTPCSICRP